MCANQEKKMKEKKASIPKENVQLKDTEDYSI